MAMINLVSFTNELEKLADVEFTSGKGDGAPRMLAGGIFLGHKKGLSQAEVEERRKYLQEISHNSKSLRDIQSKWKKKYTDDYSTLAFSRGYRPKKSNWLMSYLKGSRKAEASALKSYKDRVAHPRTFIRLGRIGSGDQNSFYNEVRRGLYDSELNQDHIKKEDRIIYW